MTNEPIGGTRATYDAVAADYHRRNSGTTAALIPGVLPAFTAGLPDPALVADVGCGPGRDLGMLREAGLRAIGLDLSLGMLRTGGRPGVVQADMRRLPLRDASVDGVWCSAALLHVPLAQTPTAVAELARVLRPGGPLFLLLAEGDGEGWRVDKFPGHPRWYAHHREPDLRVHLHTAGLTVTGTGRRSSHRDWLWLLAEKR